MEAVTHQRERLGRFVDLARVYRGWTKERIRLGVIRPRFLRAAIQNWI